MAVQLNPVKLKNKINSSKGAIDGQGGNLRSGGGGGGGRGGGGGSKSRRLGGGQSKGLGGHWPVSLNVKHALLVTRQQSMIIHSVATNLLV